MSCGCYGDMAAPIRGMPHVTRPPLDTDYVRSFFPALDDSWAFMENAGGSLVPYTVIDAVSAYMRECQVQPGDNAAIARQARQRMEAGQATAAAMLNAAPDEVIVGPSTTRNVQTLALAMRSRLHENDEIIVTNLDHEANNNHWRRLQEHGFIIREWQVDPETAELEIGALEPLLTERTRLVCFSHCSNITGGPNPVREITALVHAAGAQVCIDGVAMAPHTSIDVRELDVDYYLFSLYKTFGPHLGVMYGKREHLLSLPGQYFHFHGEDDIPLKLNPGAPNHELTAATAGVGAYLDALARHHLVEPAGDPVMRYRQVFRMIQDHESALAARFLSWAADQPRIRLVGRRRAGNTGRAPTFSFTIDGMASQQLPALLESRGIVAGAGDFYAPRVLEATGIDPADGVVRCSLVHYNTADEVDRLTIALEAIMAENSP